MGDGLGDENGWIWVGEGDEFGEGDVLGREMYWGGKMVGWLEIGWGDVG